MRKHFFWLLAPFLNEKGEPSLSRILGSAIGAALVFRMLVHYSEFAATGAAAAAIIGIVFLVTWSDIIAGKALASDVIRIAAGRLGFGSEIPAPAPTDAPPAEPA